MQLIRGQKVKLNDVMPSSQLLINVNVQSPFVTDVALFGLDNQNKLSNESYMIFYNQPNSPCGALKLLKNEPTFCQFALDVSRLPKNIQKLVITLTIDGNDIMRNLGNSSVAILGQNGQIGVNFPLNGSMFDQERAIMALEIYQKDNIWRISAVGQGFNGGLPALIEYFGGEVAEDSKPLPNSANNTSNQPNKIDLKKKLSLAKAEKTGNQSIIDLTKKSLIQLEKRNLLDVQARVALVLDASGSMNWQYNNGDVQKIVNRLMPLAINFDDDGSFECWAFAQLTTQLDDVTLTNVNNFVNQTYGGWRDWRVGQRWNDEIPAIQAVIDYYYPNRPQNAQKVGFFDKLQQHFQPPKTPNVKTQNGLPVYVLFISDGGVGSSRKMQKILTECANLPIFWQFVGVGGKDYGVLEKLDSMTGRVIDNCGFFQLDNITSVSDDRLYELLLDEFPQWLNNAKRQGIIS